jgi:hypothetical protein
MYWLFGLCFSLHARSTQQFSLAVDAAQKSFSGFLIHRVSCHIATDLALHFPSTLNLYASRFGVYLSNSSNVVLENVESRIACGEKTLRTHLRASLDLKLAKEHRKVA